MPQHDIAKNKHTADVTRVTLVVLLLVTTMMAPCQHTVALASTTGDIEQATREVSELTDQIDEKTREVEDVRTQMEQASADVQVAQQALEHAQTDLEGNVSSSYKGSATVESLLYAIVDSKSINEVANAIAYEMRITDKASATANDARTQRDAVQAKSAELSARKDELDSSLNNLQVRKDELGSKLTELKTKLAREQDETKKKAAAKAAERATQSAETATTTVTASTFSTGDTSGGSWKTGRASAYGGSSDPGSGSTTANGSRVTDWSMGVAIPLAWGRRDLLGHQIEISYNGKSVIATINDLGGMGGGSRALDLQPGVFKALGGVGTCTGWGVRIVSYRIL